MARERCSECHRLLPKPKEPEMHPICKLCKKPLVRVGKFWSCSDKDMSHRGLLTHGRVKKAQEENHGKKVFEV